MLPRIKPYNVEDFSRFFNEDDTGKLHHYFEERIGIMPIKEFKEFISTNIGKSIILDLDYKEIMAWINRLPLEIGKMFRVCCFSKDPSNILMWSHYSAKFTGCVIEFDFSLLENSEKVLMSVEYSKNRPELDIITYYRDTSDSIFMKRLLTTKAEEWNYEKEVRMILMKDDLKPMATDKGILYGIPKCSKYIKNIILGDKVEFFFKQNISELAKIKNIKVKESKLSPQEYKVEI
jgi:hypothetical protein